MKLAYSGKSKPSAAEIAQEGGFELIRSSQSPAFANWGRATANTNLNPDISNTTNKRVMRELFRDNDVPMPRWIHPDEVGYWVGRTPLVGRPDQHTRGRGFWLCHNLDDVHRALRGTRKKKPATHFFEYISAPREYRVHILNGKSLRISEKAFTDETKGSYTTAKPNPEHNINHVRKAAKQAVAALGLDFAAVDILADNDNCWVLECNAAPSLGGTMPKVYANAFKEWYENQ